MEGDRIEMSQWERDVLKVMSLVMTGKRTQVEAARLLKLSVRQVRRIRRRLKRHGDGGIVHRLRGCASNRRLDEDFRLKVIAAYKADYEGFGPTFAAEKLLEQGLRVGRETLRRWLVKEGLWQRHRRYAKHRSRRERRECFGELVQADGSIHDWLEGRGEEMVLLVMIDDATSRVMARFYPAETTEAYMDLLKRYLRKYGRMVAIYSDKDSVFKAETRDGRKAPPTQFGRALEELGIELILADSPQAKRRVERFNGTAQDRLVKELRLAGVTTMRGANKVLDEKFMPWFMRKCTVKPVSPNDAHRRIYPSMDLEAILSIQEKRTVANDYTIRLDNRIYQILPPPYPGLRGGKVIVEKRANGSIRLRFKGKYLKHNVVEPRVQAKGALPPCPRSLTHGGMPAEAQTREGRAVVATRPSAVYPAPGRSGRTPAEPCPPKGKNKDTVKQRWRPAPDHPWRKRASVSNG